MKKIFKLAIIQKVIDMLEDEIEDYYNKYLRHNANFECLVSDLEDIYKIIDKSLYK